VSQIASTPALQRVLSTLTDRLPLERIDSVWLFTPRDLNGHESGLVVLSLLQEGGEDSDARDLLTLRYDAEPAGKELLLTDELTPQGRAPRDRIPRLIDGVLARLQDEREDPVQEEIAGSADRWTDLLTRIGAATVDPSS
jgi:hypothetical protein